ncbi:MAG: cytochrome c oxidase assembly protein [Hyphomicrobiaceae bacterium]|nr:cytochrome c oxidase assembly protein [Hyphomicrobiaceae bacterium]
MDRRDSSKTDGGKTAGNTDRRNLSVALAMAALVCGMVGMSYAAVPLYQLFCQVTGYGGTTQRAEKAPDTVLERTLSVRFDANLARGMDWEFKPVQHKIEVRIGDSMLAHYEATNNAKAAITGTATFNVTPEAAGQYFNKIECFCFTEQTLEPGARTDMPLTFFIDPEIVNDPEARNIQEITLSYTFFPVEDGATVAATRKKAGGADGT